ncbi:MAG: 2-thiouracil desulfurase family protein [Candidatus Binataceae bacterium]
MESKRDGIEVQAQPVRIGVSACLLGQQVRFDGGHKRNDFLVEILGPFVQWVPVCPEVEFGLGTPRRSLRLVASGSHTRMVEAPKRGAHQSPGTDHTDAMRVWAKRRALSLAREQLSGYVLKKDSPSCGMERVKVYNSDGIATRGGRGLFAEALMRAYPALPVEEEGRLANPQLRENFIERVFAYHSLRQLFAKPLKIADLVAFHTARKLQLLSHNTKAYQELGRLVAGAKALSRGDLRERYANQFMAALRWPATPARHTNVFQHMAGYFKHRLDAASRQELHSVIADYRAGLVPLIVPITLIRHHVLTFDVGYLKGQTYLEPHPKELMLRNHV